MIDPASEDGMHNIADLIAWRYCSPAVNPWWRAGRLLSTAPQRLTTENVRGPAGQAANGSGAAAHPPAAAQQSGGSGAGGSSGGGGGSRAAPPTARRDLDNALRQVPHPCMLLPGAQ